MSRVAIVRGPHVGEVLEHNVSDGPFFRMRTRVSFVDRAIALVRREQIAAPAALYRVFGEAAPSDRDRADVYAAAWCEEHDAFVDRCPCAPEDAFTLRWVRFGPAPLQVRIEAGAPGTRESKWHLLRDWRQLEGPWVAACGIVAYGDIVEEFRHLVLTPMGRPMCKGCGAIVARVGKVASKGHSNEG